FAHFPAFQNAGIKQIINGPFTFAPDGNPLIGPIRGLAGMWTACGVMAGFSQAGGVGLALANWMIQGDPGFDVWAMDIARYGDWTTMAYTNTKVRENYSRRFSIKFPNEELTAGRPFKTTPVHERMLAAGAQMGDSWGLEAPLWFAPEGVKDVFSWRRSTDFEHVGAEVAAVRDSVGMMEISGFSKFAVKGPGARDWLDGMLACKLPNPGRMTLAPLLKHDGKLIGDLSIACVHEGDFFLAGSGMAEVYYLRWFEQHLPPDGSVTVESIGLGLTGLSIAGPNARKVLEKITHADVSPTGFRFMAIREMEIGFAPCLVGRVSFTGDLGYEIWIRPEYQRHVFDTLMEAGAEFGIRLFGLRALNAMRLEKNFGGWAREYRPLYGPLEAGLERFVAYSKPADFIGKEAAIAERDSGGALRLKMFVLEAKDADVIGDEPVWLDGEVVGWVTSGGYAHNSGVSMAMGYVPKEHANADGPWQIELLGERLAARLQHAPIWDANAERMRG
ncbi:MAG: FAD-dependent oxidoreductase, partial [Proteobacteria bacterium]|nr:FAD-dependent oxidoreductase [Pseudomonadota bacterium]